LWGLAVLAVDTLVEVVDTLVVHNLVVGNRVVESLVVESLVADSLELRTYYFID
jgi:hypothetical protein